MIDMAARMSRLGTESAFEVLARAKALEDQGKDIINLGIGQPDFKTPGHIVEAAVKALKDAGGSPKYTEYPNVGHNAWTPAYEDEALWAWMFEQKQARDQKQLPSKPEVKKTNRC